MILLMGLFQKDRIANITELNLENKGITNLNGISSFTSLINLNIRGNNLTAIDVRLNTDLLFVWAEDNQINQVNVSGLQRLEKLALDNNRLPSINVSSNEKLQLLTLPNNSITQLNVSNNPQLNNLNVINNSLICIQVNDTQLNNIPIDWRKDEAVIYSVDCN